MIQFQDVSHTFYRGSANEVKALKNIDTTIEFKEFLVLVGSNGSGKSTLLNALAGSFRIEKGSIYIEKEEVDHLKDHQRSKWISRMFQNPLSGTASDLSIMDNFRLASLRTKSKNILIGINQKFRNEVKEKISLLGMGLENKLEQKMGTLSGGQRQALTLIMAIMDEAKILLMDEPTAALDPKSSEILMRSADRIIKDFNLTCILVTHNLKDAHQYGNRIIQMREGEVIKDLNAVEKAKLELTDLFHWFA